MPCSCIQCDQCLLHPVNTFHKCLKKKITCSDCDSIITSAFKNYTKCVVGGSISRDGKKLVMKYALGMENSIMNIHLNTFQNELMLPHEFLSSKKQQIIDEINPLLKKYFPGTAKIYFFFILKMRKLQEDTTYAF